MITHDVKVSDSHILRDLRSALGDRRKMHETIAADAKALTTDYIDAESPKRHKTATSLGARPTGAMTSTGVTSDYDGAGASVSIPGIVFSRTFKDVEIKPTGGRRALTIPISAEAYGRRVKDDLDSEGWQFFLPKKKNGGDGRTLMGVKPGSKEAIPMFLLVRSITLTQDRTLLPSDDEYESTAMNAINDYLEDLK